MFPCPQWLVVPANYSHNLMISSNMIHQVMHFVCVNEIEVYCFLREFFERKSKKMHFPPENV
jgi:hypothetical protein